MEVKTSTRVAMIVMMSEVVIERFLDLTLDLDLEWFVSLEFAQTYFLPLYTDATMFIIW
jgi:hypothetical protein